VWAFDAAVSAVFRLWAGRQYGLHVCGCVQFYCAADMCGRLQMQECTVTVTMTATVIF
jgi:hypothetical protein